MARGGKGLTDEDRVLWNLVASSAVPLKGKARQVEARKTEAASEAEEPAPAKASAAAVLPVQPEPPKKQHVTGKGSSSGGDGVLKRSVPDWLATGPFRLLVSGYDEAARHHGGGGALYVRMRRKG
jgi:DNA-nicking Smr family endonuclease